MQFLHNSTIGNASAATSSVNIPVEVLVAPFGIFPSNIHVTVLVPLEDFFIVSTNELVFLAGTGFVAIDNLPAKCSNYPSLLY